MDNQHKKITGYRDLTQGEIDAMNDAKKLGRDIEEFIDMLLKEPQSDKRWVNIGKTQLQQGIMSLVRSIAKPDSF